MKFGVVLLSIFCSVTAFAAEENRPYYSAPKYLREGSQKAFMDSWCKWERSDNAPLRFTYTLAKLPTARECYALARQFLIQTEISSQISAEDKLKYRGPLVVIYDDHKNIPTSCIVRPLKNPYQVSVENSSTDLGYNPLTETIEKDLNQNIDLECDQMF